MPESVYAYDVGSMSSGSANVSTLLSVVRESSVTIALDRIDVEGGEFIRDVVTGGELRIVFKAALSDDDALVLDAIVAEHDGSPSPDDVPQVVVANNPLTREDGAVYSVPKPSSFGLIMCDRDIRLRTCLVAEADSVEDLKINTQTMIEEDWGEMSLVGVFKLVDGERVACEGQADADENGTLTVWDYHARTGGAPIVYELRDGLLYVDPTIPADEEFAHRAYAVVAPAIPAALGGSIAVFDGYLGANPDNRIEALSPQATVLDPFGPAGAAASTLRLYVVHPAGAKYTHVLRLVSYRAPGTF